MLTLASALLGAYTPPGVLAALVDEKRREVDLMRKLPEAREDGPWSLRLGYPAEDGSFGLGRVLGWRPERPAILADLKRTSPTGRLGATVSVAPGLDVTEVLVRVRELGAVGALVSTDLTSYGGRPRDLKDACTFARERLPSAAGGNDPMPIIAKDLIVDPLQIARAACDGARAVLLVAAACLPDLPALLDTCTLLGLEALVEIHTPDELTVAAECGAGLLLINERDRATGKLVIGQAIGLAPLLPPDATCLACGGLSRLDQVRMLRRAGYDGFVLGRSLLGDPRIADALMAALMAEEPIQRAVELIRVPKGLTNRSGGRGGEEEALDLDGGAASPQPPRSPPMSGTSSIGDLGI